MSKRIMLKIYLSIILFAMVKENNAQNLVPNNSFEILSSCPNNLSQILLAPPWFQPCYINGSVYNSGSSDLFNSCNVTIVGVPVNWLGVQTALSGVGYSGIHLFAPGNSREYIEIRLSDSLLQGKEYCLSFYVSLAESSDWGIDMIGAFLSKDTLLSPNFTFINVVPQVENTPGNTITDTSGWVLISGSFIAQGGEEFLTIGNFRDNANTQLSPINPPFPSGLSSYYIDDVSLVCCDSSGTCSLPEIPSSVTIPNVFSPNSDGWNDVFSITSTSLEKISCKIYNRWGTLVYEIMGPGDAWDGRTTTGTECTPGVYYYVLEAKGDDEVEYSEKGFIQLIR